MRILSSLTLWMTAALAYGNPLKSRCLKEGWVKVVSVGPAQHIQASGLCEHPSGRVFYLQNTDAPLADALWYDPQNLTYYLRDGTRRMVLSPEVRQSMGLFLEPDGSLCSLYWDQQPISTATPLVWQDWENPAAMSSDSRIVITESGRVLWVPEFNGNMATPISWSNLGWVTIRYCTWTQAAEHSLLNVVPFSAAHSVLAASTLKQGELALCLASQQNLIESGVLVAAPNASSFSRLRGCMSAPGPGEEQDRGPLRKENSAGVNR